MSSKQLARTGVSALVGELTASKLNGRTQTEFDRLGHIRKIAEHGGIPTLETFLPLCLTLRGKPYTLSNHFPFSPIFKTNMPATVVLKTGRQVSKSTSLASHGVLLSNCIPDFRTMHVTPRYEQIRRFSNNYVRPFIERSPIKSLWTGTNTENSVLQRSFKNHAIMLFSFALLDADRIRGVSCDKLAIDESWCGETTYVNSNRGVLKIKDIKSGDIVDSFHQHGTILRKTVLANSYHGYRQCWRVRFASGAELTMTAESGIASNQGWLHASEIIKRMYDAHQRAGMHDSGNDARGRVNIDTQSVERGVSKSPRLVPASVQPGQRPNVISVRKQTTRDAEEQWLRKMVECLLHTQPSDIHAFRRIVLQPPTPNETVQAEQSSSSHQGSDTKLAGLDRSCRFSADDRVVVHGRRDQTRDCHITVDHMEHAGLHRSRGAVVSSVADETRVRVDLPGDLQQKAAGVLLRREDAGRTYAQTPAATHAVHRAFDVIQDIHLSNRSADVCLLQPGVRPSKNTIQRSAEATKTPVLSTTGVFESQTSGTLQQAHGETWSARTAEPASTESLLQESRSNEEIQSRNDAYLSPEQSCSRESRKTQGCCESASITTADGVAMSTLWFDQTAGQNAQQYKILSSVSGGCHQRNQATARGYQTDWDADQGVSGVSANVPVDEQRTEVVFSGVQDDHGESSTQTEIPTETEGWVWDQIVAVEDAGFRHVWDLHIEDTAVFCPNGIAGTNCQDMDPDHFPIMRECMSHSDYALTQFAGTPKSLDNPLEGLWQKSSQAEWHIPCYSCGKWNIPSREFHVDKMIGPVHEGISENCPGTICYNCRRPVFPRHGRWVHRFPDRRARMTGYHVPQIIMPLHYGRPDKWGELCAKRDGWANTSQAVFCNEVLGESVDAGQRLISETELRAAATLPWTNKPDDPDPEMLKRLPFYKQRVLAVDWGGGGEDGVSFTALALLGLTPSNEIHVLWGKRLVLSQEHLREAVEIKHWMNRFSCDLLVHDYTGAGIVRETVLVQAGLPLEKVMPVQYVRAAAANLIKYVPASVLHNRDHYRLDKTRSLLYAFQAIKTKLVKTFKYDYVSSENAGLMSDFLALVEDKRESRLSSDIYTITRNPLLTDDFAQAVNIGCSAIWHSNSCWPDFAAAANIARITIAQEMDAGSANYGWESGPTNFFQRGY